MVQVLLSPSLECHYSQGCDGSFEAQEELNGGCCFLIAAQHCSSHWTSVVSSCLRSWSCSGPHPPGSKCSLSFPAGGRDQAVPVCVEESDTNLLNPVCLQIADKMDVKERKEHSVSARSLGSIKKGKSLGWKCCQMN